MQFLSIATPTVHKNCIYVVYMLKIRFNRCKCSRQVFAGRIQVVSLPSFITKVLGYLKASFLNNVVYAMWSGHSTLSNVYQFIICPNRLIVIAEKNVVYSKFPIPLINRLEKHYLVTSASLSSPQKLLVDKLQEWVTRFSHVNIPRHQQLR